MKMKKFFLVLLILVAGVFLGKNLIARAALSMGVKAVTGLRLQIDRMAVGVMTPVLHVEGLKLFQPEGFPEGVMIDLPELKVHYDRGALFRGKAHLHELTLHLREFVVVKDAQGRVNLNSLTAVQKARSQEQKPAPAPKKSPLRIDSLHLKIGKVLYKDYSRGAQSSVQEFVVDIDEHYSNITDPTALGGLIVTRALWKTTVANLANFDLQGLDRAVWGILDQSMGRVQDLGTGVVDSAVGAVGEAVGSLKKLLPFGEPKEK